MNSEQLQATMKPDQKFAVGIIRHALAIIKLIAIRYGVEQFFPKLFGEK